MTKICPVTDCTNTLKQRGVNIFGGRRLNTLCQKHLKMRKMLNTITQKPDSPEEKKCCEECEFVYGGVTSPKMRECKYNGLDRNCSCHKPETTNEKDFIESALSEYERRWNYHGVFQNKEAYPHIYSFLKEKLTEVIHQKSMTDIAMAFEMGEKSGRLAMKEEVEKKLEQFMTSSTVPILAYRVDRTIEGNMYITTLEHILAAIRDMK